MPRYDFRCPSCGVFEAQAGRDDRFIEHDCGSVAERRPFSGVPALKGETVSRNIPDADYRQDALKRESRASGWDVDRAVRTMRKGLVEDGQGNKSIDMKKVANA